MTKLVWVIVISETVDKTLSFTGLIDDTFNIQYFKISYLLEKQEKWREVAKRLIIKRLKVRDKLLDEQDKKLGLCNR